MLLNLQNLWLLGLLMLMFFIAFKVYQKDMYLYASFPSYPFISCFMYAYVLRKIPKHMSITSYCLQTLIRVSKIYENEGLFFFWLFEPILCIYSEDAMKTFSTEKAALDKSYTYDMLKNVFGEGLATSNGDAWKKNRKILNPVFHTDMLKNKISIYNRYADNMMEDLSQVADKPVDLVHYLKTCSFCVIYESILGLSVEDNSNKELCNRCLETVLKLSECTSQRIVQPWMKHDIIFFSTPYGKEFLKWYQERKYMLQEVLIKAKKSISKETSGEKFENSYEKLFLHTLFEHQRKDPSITDQYIQDEICTFISGGFYTTAHTMLWCLFLLGHHADIQKKVYKEILSETGQYISNEDICNLKYLDCVIKETLRLYPVIPIYGRLLKKDVQCGKYKVPKGTTLVFFPYALHKNSDVFPDPETFNPDRFLDGNILKRPWAYVPFSEGIRSCIGKQFALMEMKVVLSYLLRNYEVKSLDEIKSVDLKWDVVLTPNTNLQFQLVPRKS